MTTKPKNTKTEFSADEWIAKGGKIDVADQKEDSPVKTKEKEITLDINEEEPTTRFTIDVPISLHARIKSQCALKRVKMREEIIMLLEGHFSAK